MVNYNYCEDCKRIFTANSSCPFCKSTQVNALNIKAPVNVLGTKVKARVFKLSPEGIKVLIEDEKKDKVIKDFDASKLRKVL